MKKKVLVQDKDRQPLMPTKPARARRKLDKGEAEVVQREPFTIRLKYEIEKKKNTEEVTVGIDSGYSNIGFSVRTEKEELIAGVMDVSNNIPKKLEEKRGYRRQRRSRNTRYRKPRNSKIHRPKPQDNKPNQKNLQRTQKLHYKTQQHQKTINYTQKILQNTEPYNRHEIKNLKTR
ncbi:RRXRR domain-containing protein [Methanonatronarchaeum sp. AMET6-2]|uniref:RRXRR domain-containing protein n=1 Tax=Methanonatronarchaeum sp. AMET6-2 TaxID=2933293 RepID=UPI001FF13ED5|nr:RRXRR domain-containing protein [Methanonatronarchaeum sp. AMET6-2]UOY09688.1 RRXRR domain-containing protein [Methanonatronarchaeum sp. AMET6-2]